MYVCVLCERGSKNSQFVSVQDGHSQCQKDVK